MNKLNFTIASLAVLLGASSCATDDSVDYKYPSEENHSKETAYFEENFDGLGAGLSAWTLINDANKVNGYYKGKYDNAWVVTDFGLYNNNYDNKMAVSCSWFDPDAPSDRWMISPKFKVSGDDPYLYWEECTPDPQNKQCYKVLVSEGDADKASFKDVIYQIPQGENGEIMNTLKGASLAKYKGKDVRVAFVNNAPKNAFLVAIDNIFLSPKKLTSVPLNLSQKIWSLNYANVSWEDYSDRPNGDYEISVVKFGEKPTAAGRMLLTSRNSNITISDLKEATRYHVYLRSKGMSHWSGPYPVQTASNLPYGIDFESNLMAKGIISELGVADNTPIKNGKSLVANAIKDGEYYLKMFTAPIYISKGKHIKVSYDYYCEGAEGEGSLKLNFGSFADGDRGLEVDSQDLTSKENAKIVKHVEITLESVFTDIYRFWITFDAYPTNTYKVYVDNFKVEYVEK